MKNQIKNPNILMCSNRFSILECNDDENVEDVENIGIQIQKTMNAKKNKKRKIMKNRNKVKHAKQNLNPNINDQQLNTTWSMCGQCFRNKFPKKKLDKQKSMQKRHEKPKDIDNKNFTMKEIQLILQHVAFLEESKGTKAAIVVKIAGDRFISRDNFWPYRLRGGADSNSVDTHKVREEDYLSSLHKSSSMMVDKAIENAKYHNINLYHGVPNMAGGNCAFESIIDNISTRQCFAETFDGTPDYWRFVWMSEVENIAYKNWHGTMSPERWKAEFKILKETRAYEMELGDLIVPGIAHCTRKNILIFNTSEQARSPIYVIPANTFGRTANTDIPVCLAYNQVHYEGLVPCSEEDILKTITLTKQFLDGEYNLMMKNIPLFRKTVMDNHEKECPHVESGGQQVNSGLAQNRKECSSILDDLKRIPAKIRTAEQNKEIKRLMAKRRKESMSEETLEKIRKKRTENKQLYRNKPVKQG